MGKDLLTRRDSAYHISLVLGRSFLLEHTVKR
jgi:hypothetical protein